MTTLIPKIDLKNGGSTPTGAVNRTINEKAQDIVSVKDFGAVGDGVADDTTAIQNAATYCTANDQVLYFSAGVYKISTAISAGCAIRGDGPTVSIIKNFGTGDALDLSPANYYTTYENFSVDGSGNASSRDGISLYNTTSSTGNVAYSHFFNVYSYSNGRNGLYHRYAWATRYSQCKFYSNAGLGVYIDTEIGDTGGANGVSFLQCDARFNGGTTSGFGGLNGGVKIKGCSSFSWVGGIIESNSGYGVYVGDAPSTAATRNIRFQDTYFEYNGYEAAVGGLMYASGPWANIVVDTCWLSYAATTGNTNYCFFINQSTDNGNFVQKNNTFVPLGAGTLTRFNGANFAQNVYSYNTQPAFDGYQNASVSVATSTATKLPINTLLYDTNQNFDATTNYRFTPTVPGYYQVNGCMNYMTGTGGGNLYVSIYKNGSEFKRGSASTATTSQSSNVSSLVYLNGVSDYIELYVFQSLGSTQTYNPATGLTYFNACLLK